MEESYRLIKPYIRGLPIIVVALIAGYLTAVQYLKYVNPMYESVARLRLADLNEGVPNSNLFKDFDVFATSNKIAAEIELIKSELMINKTLDTLDFDIEIYRVGQLRTTELYHDSPFLIRLMDIPAEMYNRDFDLFLARDHSYELILPGGQRLQGMLGDTLYWNEAALLLDVDHDLLATREDLHISDHYTFKKLSRDRLVAQIKQNLTVVSVDKDVAVLRIIFNSPHPFKASQFPDKLALTYIQDYIGVKSEAAGITVSFLDQQVWEVSQRLAGIERDILEFRETNLVTNIPQETETIIRELSQMRIQHTNLRMSLNAINELDQYIRDGIDNFEQLAPNFEAFTDLLSTELIKNVKELQSERRDLLLIYTPQEERVRIIDEKLTDISGYFLESISNTRRNLEIRYDNLERDIRLSELRLVNYPDKERQMTILRREFEIYQESYNFLNEKKIEAEIARAATISFHRIIEQAGIPRSPYSPNYTIIKIASALLGATLAVVLIFLVHALKARVNDLHAIQTNSAIPVAATTPNIVTPTMLREHFMKVVNELDTKGFIQHGGILNFSSYSAAEGHAFHAMHTAEALSIQNRRVLLIDVSDETGLSAAPARKLHQVSNHLSVMHLDSPEFFSYTNEKMSQLVGEIARNFDLTVVANDLLGRQLALQFLHLASANFIVVDARLTPVRRIPQTAIMLDEFGVKNARFILNRFGYNPNIIAEIMGWVFKKTGLRAPAFKSWSYEQTL
jgi:uncharacterized protein involved in exopolysaccharide biosynthesis